MHIRLAAAIVASVVLLGAAPAWPDADKEGESRSWTTARGR